MTGNLSYVPKQKDDSDWGTSWHVGKISSITGAVGRADLGSSLQHMTCCHPLIHPGITRVPFGCPSLTGVMIKKNGGGANETKMAWIAHRALSWCTGGSVSSDVVYIAWGPNLGTHLSCNYKLPTKGVGKTDADTEWSMRDQCGECQANMDLEKSHFCCNYKLPTKLIHVY
jgi:hypothetical protein